MIALTWVGMNKEYVKTNSSVRTDNFVVSTVSHGLMTQPNSIPRVSIHHPGKAVISRVRLPRKSLFDIFMSYPRLYIQRHSYDFRRSRCYYFSAVHRSLRKSWARHCLQFYLRRDLGVSINSTNFFDFTSTPYLVELAPTTCRLEFYLLTTRRLLGRSRTPSLTREKSRRTRSPCPLCPLS